MWIDTIDFFIFFRNIAKKNISYEFVLNACNISFLKAVDFLDKLLRSDHQGRATAKEAMVNP